MILVQLGVAIRRVQPSMLSTVHKIGRMLQERDFDAHQREQYLMDMVSIVGHWYQIAISFFKHFKKLFGCASRSRLASFR